MVTTGFYPFYHCRLGVHACVFNLPYLHIVLYVCLTRHKGIISRLILVLCLGYKFSFIVQKTKEDGFYIKYILQWITFKISLKNLETIRGIAALCQRTKIGFFVETWSRHVAFSRSQFNPYTPDSAKCKIEKQTVRQYSTESYVLLPWLLTPRKIMRLIFDAFFPSFSLAESPPRDLQIILCSCVIETTLWCENGRSVARAVRD